RGEPEAHRPALSGRRSHGAGSGGCAEHAGHCSQRFRRWPCALQGSACSAPDSDRKVLTMRIRSVAAALLACGLLCSCSKEKEHEEEPVLPVQLADVESAPID